MTQTVSQGLLQSSCSCNVMDSTLCLGPGGVGLTTRGIPRYWSTFLT
jgi:hypothetical protein